jgi:hypothetical protein
MYSGNFGMVTLYPYIHPLGDVDNLTSRGRTWAVSLCLIVSLSLVLCPSLMFISV